MEKKYNPNDVKQKIRDLIQICQRNVNERYTGTTIRHVWYGHKPITNIEK